ncbi:SDR family NAD(P)-dependent oxidoreductase [Clavibacter sepedonicus]|uniref:SDR family NAD(P)-dependent oxidoreductase n=1 Tax=Clavibacter TaxID=1573 RepID=UPI00030DDF59|nr:MULTISPECIES: SDR family oxidoreductase [Clavibacter]UUK67052.1 SDR family oxidoreductase [Clavibacter sepedonicus]
MKDRLDDQVVIVTGAASGIGRGTALRLLSEGAVVTALDLRDEDLAKLADAVPAHHRERLSTGRVDIADEHSVQSAVADVLERNGRIDGLVNAAGILYGDHTHEMTLERWNRLVQVNLTGTFLVVREALPALVATGSGVIVNFASTSAFYAHPYMAAYAATKGAIAAFTHSVALEYAKDGLRAINIVPGGIHSGITSTTPQNLPADADWSILGHLGARLGDGDMGRPEDRGGHRHAPVRGRGVHHRDRDPHRQRDPRIGGPPAHVEPDHASG